MSAKVVFTCDVCGREECVPLRLGIDWDGYDVPDFDEPKGWDIYVDVETTMARCPDHKTGRK